jgi:hypothetical protein
MVMSPMKPRIKNDYTDKGQQQFTQLLDKKPLTLKPATAIFAKSSQTFNILHGVFLKAEVIQNKCILTELLKYFKRFYDRLSESLWAHPSADRNYMRCKKIKYKSFRVLFRFNN